jgi:1-acyl-sn-glycerol-3-phosphate acyltransferase
VAEAGDSANVGRLQPAAELVAGRAIAWFCRLSVRGAEHVPPSGPVILAATHESMFDVPIVVIASPRPVSFMAHRDLFRRRFGAWFFRSLGGFPVHRGDSRGVAVAIDVLRRGRVLGVFPEGTRNFGRGTAPFLAGAAWLALRTGASIVPCSVAGTALPGPRPHGWWKWLRRRHARVRFGPPIPVERVASTDERRRAARDLTLRLQSAVAALHSP